METWKRVKVILLYGDVFLKRLEYRENRAIKTLRKVKKIYKKIRFMDDDKFKGVYRNIRSIIRELYFKQKNEDQYIIIDYYNLKKYYDRLEMEYKKRFIDIIRKETISNKQKRRELALKNRGKNKSKDRGKHVYS